LQNFEIYNLGIPGYGIDQIILAYEKYFKKINPDIILLFYIDDDIPRILEAFRRMEGMNKPSFDIVNDMLKQRINNKKSFLTRIFENSYFLNRFYKKYMDYYSISLAMKLFDRLIDSTAREGQKLIVIRCPNLRPLLDENDFSFYSFSEYFKQREIDYYELYEVMKELPKDYLIRLYLEYDGHPSELGAEYLANEIIKISSNIF